MNSPHQREQLPDLLCDALTDAERARVESHLAQCAQCARELRALQSMQQTVAALPVATPPDRIRAGVRAALRENPKQAWSWSSLLANRQRTATARALPFALATRQLAWGGAVAVAAVGLMLLARPSLQNSSYSTSAPVSESELAARADQDAMPAPGAAVAPAPKNSEPKENQRPKAVAKSPRPPAIAPPRAVQPEGLAPTPAAEFPSAEMPASESAPQPSVEPTRTPRANKRSVRPVAPPKRVAPAQKSKSDAQPTAQAQRARDQSAPATGTQSAPALSAPKAPIASADSESSDRARSGDAATAPGTSASTSDGAREQEKDRGNDNAPAPPVTTDSAFEAAPMARQSQPKSSPAWMGGEVTATITRAQSFAGRTRVAPQPNAPILTLAVSKPIGDARLFVRLPEGEVQIWTGVVNETPVKINLDAPALTGANLRGGQKIRARLEQIDGEGNPKGSTLFDLLWPSTTP